MFVASVPADHCPRRIVVPLLARLGTESEAGAATVVQHFVDEPDDGEFLVGVFRVLTKLGTDAKDAAPRLQKLLDSESAFVRTVVAESLIQITDDPEAPLAVLEELLNDQESKNQMDALTALRDLGVAAKTSLPKVVDLFEDSDEDVRGGASHVAAVIAGDDISPIVDKLNSEDKHVRIAAL
ncbi:MAG: hypothetical protein MI757_06050, partial [Pirellulales bacterium]|nr:hypothetical protein [Pirellulales bacterium]